MLMSAIYGMSLISLHLRKRSNERNEKKVKVLLVKEAQTSLIHDTNKEKVMKLFYMRLKRLYVVYSTRVQIDIKRYL